MSSSSSETPASPPPASNASPASNSTVTPYPQADAANATDAAGVSIAAKAAMVVDSLPDMAFGAATIGYLMALSPKGNPALAAWYTSLLVTAAIAAGVAKFRLVDSVIANPVRLAVAWTYIAIALTCIIFGAGILLYAIVFPEPREDGTFSPAKGSSVAQRSAGAFAAVMAFTLIFGGLALPAPASGARSVASQAETGVPTGIPLQRISISASSSSPAD